jgi:hypothetical protein
VVLVIEPGEKIEKYVENPWFPRKMIYKLRVFYIYVWCQLTGQYERDKLDFGSSCAEEFWKNTARSQGVRSQATRIPRDTRQPQIPKNHTASLEFHPSTSNAGIQRGSSPARPTSLWEASRASTPPDARDGWCGG